MLLHLKILLFYHNLENIHELSDLHIYRVEGGELNVMKGLNLEKYKPTLLVIENVFDNLDYLNYLKEHGYRLDKQIDYNQYYIRE